MPEPTSVLEVSPRFPPDLGGVETHVQQIASRLCCAGDLRITVAATDRHNEYAAVDFTGPYPVLRVRAWPARQDFYVAPGLWRLIRNGTWDVVHVQGIHTAVPLVAMRAARAAGIPYVVTFHSAGHTSALRQGVRSAQWKALAPLLRGASRLVAVSRFEQRLFGEAIGIDPDEILLIQNGGGLPAPLQPVDPVPGRIVSSGRLERYKGHHRVIEALPEVRRSVPDAHLHVLGSGPYEQPLRQLASRLGVGDLVTIRLVPPTDRHAMSVALAEAAVVAALSDYEAHPVAVMEALALGTPVVGADVAGVGDLVEDGLVTGVPADAGSDEIAAALVGAMGAPRPAVTPALPTWDGAAARLGALYLEVAAQHRSGVATSSLVP